MFSPLIFGVCNVEKYMYGMACYEATIQQLTVCEIHNILFCIITIIL